MHGAAKGSSIDHLKRLYGRARAGEFTRVLAKFQSLGVLNLDGGRVVSIQAELREVYQLHELVRAAARDYFSLISPLQPMPTHVPWGMVLAQIGLSRRREAEGAVLREIRGAIEDSHEAVAAAVVCKSLFLTGGARIPIGQAVGEIDQEVFAEAEKGLSRATSAAVKFARLADGTALVLFNPVPISDALAAKQPLAR